MPVQQQPPREERGAKLPPEDVQGMCSQNMQHILFLFSTIQDRKLVEEFVYFNQTKPKMPVAATKNLKVKEEEGEENWENELVEHSYNPLEVVKYIRSLHPNLSFMFAGHQEEECSEEG